jgi:FG-GAP-like repeat
VATAVSYDDIPDNYVTVMLGQGDGTFESSWSGPYSGRFDSLALADFDGDGNVDVAVPGFVFPGNGDGTLGAPRDLGVIVPSPAVGGRLESGWKIS